jgi:putative transposase
VCVRDQGAGFEAWQQRRLNDVELDYLFLDGSHFKYHANAAAEPVLAAGSITTDGKPGSGMRLRPGQEDTGARANM